MSRSHPGSATLVEVARRAGVSVATASRALTGHGPASPHARAVVRRAATELGYVPNPLAVSLARGRGNRIVLGILAPDPEMLTDQYPTRLIAAATLAADPHGMGIATRWLRPDDASPFEQLAHDRSIHGLILVNHTPELLDALPASLRGRVTVVGPGFGRAPSHDVDPVAATTLRVRHLVAGGRRRIAMLAGPAWLPSLRRPVAAYQATMDAYGLPSRIVTGDHTLTGGQAGAQTALHRWPDTDAIMALSDSAALGVLATLADNGRRAPEDIAVIGFDDVPFAALGRPPLTTVTHPVEQIAAGAVQSLLAGRMDPGDSVIYPTTLVERQSS